jgi:NAD-dependent deacetylase
MFRRDLVEQGQPNPGHYALVDLEELVPKLVVLTQNVDGLHKAAGSTDVIELHGNLRRFKCSDDCQGSPTIVELDSIVYNSEHAPSCPRCGALIRPDVVWYGETLPSDIIVRAFGIARKCDVMLVVGTSGVVQPAASLPVEAQSAGATVIEINMRCSQLAPVVDIFLQGSSGQVLPQLVAAVQACRNRSLNAEN